jgi:hypothetical protein
MPEDNVVPFTMNRASLEIVERRAHIEGSAIVQSATALAVADAEGFLAAGELRKEVNTKDAILEKEFKPIKQAIDTAKKTVLEFERKAREPFITARGIIDGKIVTYQQEQRRVQQEREDALRRAAKKIEDDRRLREAELAVAAGATEEQALEILEQPSTAPPPSVPLDVPRVAGLSFRESWKARVTDFNALVAWSAMHPEMAASLLVPNETGINGLARSQKAALSIPGVEAYCEQVVSGTRS